MPFWPVVVCSLIGIPMVLLFTGMGMIFWAAGLAGGPQESQASKIVYGWLAFAWVLASVFGAFGLAPAWRAWHDGDQSFVGGLHAFGYWLAGIGAVGGVVAVALGAMAKTRQGDAKHSLLENAVRWLVLSIGLAPWAAIVAWIAWPLVLWPVRGSFAWPDAATGWTHTGEVTAILFAAMLVEEAVRRRLKR